MSEKRCTWLSDFACEAVDLKQPWQRWQVEDPMIYKFQPF